MSVSRILRAFVVVVIVSGGLCLTAGAGIASAASARDDDTLERAKSLYVSADYDEALAVLDRLESTAAGDEVTSIAQYRVFCLLALNRRTEARESIDRILHDQPLYMPTDNEASPRIQSIFQDVRREVLPKIVLERYAAAKQAFERKDPRAGQQFDDVLTLLNDPDLSGSSMLKDLREVASAFRDLSRAVAAAPPPSAAAAKPGAPAAAAPAPAAEVAHDVIYTAADTDVIPPVSQSQKAPPWYPSSRMAATQEYRGALRLLIDRAGTVVSATMPAGTNPEYDLVLLRAARDWKFQPAQRQGKPVQYLKVIEIHLQPTQR